MLALDEFTGHVTMSGLVAPEVMAQVRGQLAPEPSADAAVRLARRLIEGGWLTTYQAKKLLGGATRGFFLGGYRLMRPLGEGGMGKVYLAVNDRQAQVAIKVLPPRKALEEQNALRRFRREMELSQRCSHPNLARTHSVCSEGDVNIMVMEYIPGKEPVRPCEKRGGRPASGTGCRTVVLEARRRAGGGPSRGAGASRYQTVEHHDHARGRCQAARLGTGAGPRRRDGADAGQYRARNT